MRLVVTHEQPDFDALASAALATLLFPGSVAALAGTLEGGVGEVLKLYRDQFSLVTAEEVDLDEVRELIVVDTSDRGRLGRFSALVGRVPVTVFDHHPRPSDPVHGTHGIREAVGATVTLLARRLRAEGVTLDPPLASLALLGLHEDTGDFTFDGTTHEDHSVAAWLQEQGANLDLVRRFRSPGVPSELVALRDEILANAREHRVSGRSVAVASFASDDYVPSASGLANELLFAVGADAAVVTGAMDGRTLVFARSTPRVDVSGALARALGGGGHPRAAFARTDLAPDAALEAVLAALPPFVVPPLLARDIMSSPVVRVDASARLAEARQLLARHRHNGVPVVDADGTLVGVISRRDLDHAIRHGFAEARVSGFMTAPAITAGPAATLRDLEELVLAHDIGRVPIVANAPAGTAGGDSSDTGPPHLVGIVTRSDLIRARHARAAPSGPAERVLASLPGGARDVLTEAARVAGDARLYLVGGTVRDGLLGVGYHDLDLVVEGHAFHGSSGGDDRSPAEMLAQSLREHLGGTLSTHAEFGTASLRLDSGLVVDVASARTEAYLYPGALPQVHEGALFDDLSRRDFGVNALAVRVHPEPPELVDHFGGLVDLEARRLRVLHPLSFVEDPTRIVRGARLAGRLGLDFDADTRAKVPPALAPDVLGNVSGARLRAELELTLAEARVAPALAHLVALGAMAPLYALEADADALQRLDTAREEAAKRGEASDPGDGQVAAYLMLLLVSTADREAERAIERFHLPRRLAATRDRIRALARGDVPPSDERLEVLDAAARRALVAFAPHLREAVASFEHAPDRPRVRGRDVVRLGLPPGPRVGDVLARIERARNEGTVADYAGEMALARSLVEHLTNAEEPGPNDPER
ncbi:MAG: CBS domain-containing protein [Trueperaceae bacterium]|nr:CBS domain-containing protein [Trueperaceae bacterium]